MVEQLIEAIKNHEVIYNKSSLIYKNKVQRAAAWSAINTKLHLSVDVCHARWNSLRDKFVKNCTESHHAPGSRAAMKERLWKYQKQKVRRTVTSIVQTEKRDNHLEVEMDSFTDTYSFDGDFPTTPTSTESNSIPFDTTNTSRKNSKLNCDSEAFGVFLNQISVIAETRFTTPSLEKGAHDGVFPMVREIFDDMESEAVKNAKFFFLNYLQERAKK